MTDPNLPLAGRRVAVTLPPQGWFGGVDYNFAVEMTDELRRLGAAVFVVDVAGFISQNEVYIANVVEGLRSFKPEVAISLPNALYILLCATADQRNLFRDVLGVPSLMLWDHGLLQLPRQILGHYPSTPEESHKGAAKRIRRILDHPLYLHYSPDTGHIAALDRMGALPASKAQFFLQPAYPNFASYRYRTPPRNLFRSRVAFAGNVYIKGAKDLPFRTTAALAGIEARAIAAKKASLRDGLWDLLLREIEALDSGTRKQLKLDPNQTFFWHFMHEEIGLAGNTEVRLDVLTKLRYDLDFYGNFMEPGSVGALQSEFRVRFRKSLDYFTELPLLFVNSDVIVDVINLGYNTGVSPKIMGCFAAGGLMLFDYKTDFARVMDDAGSAVMYRDAEHLNTLIDGYLTRPNHRRDVVQHLQDRISREFTWAAMAKRLMVDERAWK